VASSYEKVPWEIWARFWRVSEGRPSASVCRDLIVGGGGPDQPRASRGFSRVQEELRGGLPVGILHLQVSGRRTPYYIYCRPVCCASADRFVLYIGCKYFYHGSTRQAPAYGPTLVDCHNAIMQYSVEHFQSSSRIQQHNILQRVDCQCTFSSETRSIDTCLLH